MALSPSYVSLSTGYHTLVDFLTPGVVTLGSPSSSSKLMSESLDSPPACARDVPPCSAIFSLPFLGLFAWADPLLSAEFLSLPLHGEVGELELASLGPEIVIVSAVGFLSTFSAGFQIGRAHV